MKRLIILTTALLFLTTACDDGSGSNNDEKLTMAERIAQCSDNKDNDGNGLVDCADIEKCEETPICQDGKRIEHEDTLALCSDGYDNNLNGKTDCENESCKVFEHCHNTVPEDTEELCKDGKDNDGNGKTDCEDPKCQKFAHCQTAVDPSPENTEALCKDGKDNDGNGLIDCDDPGCKDFAHCQKNLAKGENTYELCSDGKDNDGDGLIDCDDPECWTFKHCLGTQVKGETTEAQCKDGEDNDGDGFVDCEEGACQKYDFCEDECPSDRFKFVKGKCPCGETELMDGSCAINIYTKDHLIAYANDYSRDAVIKLDIDLGRIDDWNPIGSLNEPYQSKLVGNGKRISGTLQCKNKKYCGLFGVAEDADFVDLEIALTLKNDVTNAEDAAAYSGGLLARGEEVRIANISIPSKVYAKGEITGTANSSKCLANVYSGGLAAMLTNSLVVNITANEGAATAESVGMHSAVAGGLVAYLSNSTITSVNMTGATVTAHQNNKNQGENRDCDLILSGGIVGYSKDSKVEKVEFLAATTSYITNGEVTDNYKDPTANRNQLYSGAVAAYSEKSNFISVHGTGYVSASSGLALINEISSGGIVGILKGGLIDGATFRGKAEVLTPNSESFYNNAINVGGIVGHSNALNADNTPVVRNVQSFSELRIHAKDSVNLGGLLGYSRKTQVANGMAQTQFESYKGGSARHYMGGLIGRSVESKLVNTYAQLTVDIPEGTEANPVIPPTVAALIAYAENSFLYESYWTKILGEEAINVNLGSLLDTTCLEYSVSESNPTPTLFSTSPLLNKLRQNVGFDYGIVSVNLPLGNYFPWKTVTSNIGLWPELDLQAQIYLIN